MKLIWRAEARQNLQTIVRYIAERNPAAADDLVDRMRSCLERLSDHPLIYRQGRIANTREAVVHPNYILVYRVAADAVEIIDVLHTRREYPPSEPE